jgi:hypothetical protein
MHSGLFRDRRAATIVAVSAAAALLFLLWRPSAGGGTALDLSLGIFGGVAAALTFALALLNGAVEILDPTGGFDAAGHLGRNAATFEPRG